MQYVVYIANRIKNETINANNPVASANANPNIAYANNCPLSAGFLATPVIRAPKTVPIPVPAPMSPAAAAPAPMSLPAPRMATPTETVSVTMPRDWPRVMFVAVLRIMARLMRRPELRGAGWNREMEVVGPDVKARRAIGFACRNVEAPLRRAERAASWAMEFMMIADGIDDGEWSLRY